MPDKFKQNKPVVFKLDKKSSAHASHNNARYTYVKELDSGSFGSTHLVTDKNLDNLNKLMKIIIDSNADEAAMNDMKAMQEIQHENIVKYYNQFIEEKNCILFVEYHTQDLAGFIAQEKANYLKQIEQDKAWRMSMEILDALKYLHSEKKIIHRNIKPDNSKIKLGDLGLANDISRTVDLLYGAADKKQAMMLAKNKALYYMSADMLESGGSEQYDFRADMWSFGCVVYEMLTFEAVYEKFVVKGIEPSSEIPDNASEQFALILKNCLVEKKNDRCTSQSLWDKINQFLQDKQEPSKSKASKPSAKKSATPRADKSLRFDLTADQLNGSYVFLSYAFNEKETERGPSTDFIKLVNDRLKKEGFRVWMNVASLNSSKNSGKLYSNRQKAIESSCFFLTFINNSYVSATAADARMELNYAVETIRENTNGKNKMQIIPVFLKDYAISDLGHGVDTVLSQLASYRVDAFKGGDALASEITGLMDYMNEHNFKNKKASFEETKILWAEMEASSDYKCRISLIRADRIPNGEQDVFVAYSRERREVAGELVDKLNESEVKASGQEMEVNEPETNADPAPKPDIARKSQSASAYKQREMEPLKSESVNSVEFKKKIGNEISDSKIVLILVDNSNAASPALFDVVSYAKSLNKRIKCIMMEKINYTILSNGAGVLLTSMDKIDHCVDHDFELTIRKIKNDLSEIESAVAKKKLMHTKSALPAELVHALRPVKSARPQISSIHCCQCLLCKRDYMDESIRIHFKLKHPNLSLSKYSKRY